MYSRNLGDGEILTFAASGWVWNDTLVLVDRETRSLWFDRQGPTTGRYLTCVAGPHQDKVLPVLDSSRAVWRSWVAARPDTKVMVAKD